MIHNQTFMGIERINKSCSSYPCHEGLEDCTFCYCPLYPCEITEYGGKYLTIYKGTSKEKIWDCSKCTWIHTRSFVDQIYEVIRLKIKQQKI